MPILADTIDGVIGVDTHRDTLAAAAVSPVGGVLAQTATRADATGYQQLLEFAGTQIPSDPARRCWAIEGAGSYGAGLTAFLHTHGERVVEVARPKRPTRGTGAKTDAIDAIRAARETLGHQHQTLPRRRGDREALRVLLTTRRHATSSRVAAVNQLKALIVGAPEELRAELRGVATTAQIGRCAGLRDRPAKSLEHRMTVRVLRTTAGAHPGPPRRDRPAHRCARHPGRLDRAMAGRTPWRWSRHRRPGAGQLVVCRTAAL
jgi:transposase